MKILFFSPHSIPWKHSFPEAILADSLKNSGNEIIYLTCGGILGDYCIPKIVNIPGENRNKQLNERRQAVCRECQNTSKYIEKNFNFTGPTIRSFLSQDSMDQVDRIVSSLNIKNALELKHLGINIGRIAFYQIILRYKLINLVLSKDLFERYLSELRDTFYAALAVQKMIELNKIEAIILYNSMYSVNRIVVEIAKIHNINIYFIHAGSNLSERLQSLMIGKNDDISFRYNLIKNWPKFSKSTFSREQFKKVTEHFRELVSGKSIFTYSTKKPKKSKNIRSYFSIPDSLKVLVATMASYDEEIATEFIGAKEKFDNEIFSSQIEWIKALIDYAKKNQNIFLIIRPHPREFSNKREKMTSEHARQILELITSGLPSNVRFNLPIDGISIYDYIDQADVFLNSWSNVGKEIAIFGVPVVIYSRNNLYYHPDLNYIGENKANYFEKIEEALISDWSFEWVVKAYKWYVYEQQVATISIESACKIKESNRKSLVTLIIEKLIRLIDPKLLYFLNIVSFKKSGIHIESLDKLISSGGETILDILDVENQISINMEIESIKTEFERLLKIAYPVNSALINSRIYKNYNLFFSK
jgi:hypothetical protein